MFLMYMSIIEILPVISVFYKGLTSELEKFSADLVYFSYTF